MRVYVKNKLVSLGGSSTVFDEDQNPIYKVKGKVFSPTNKKIIYDMEGMPLYTVRNKWFNFFIHSAYVYDGSKQKIARVKDKFFNFKNEFFVEGFGDEIRTEGQWLSMTSQILKNGEVIGTINRQITAASLLGADVFAIEAKEEDMPFVIALVIAIDNIVDKQRKKSRR